MTNPRNVSKIKETKKQPDIEWNDKNITAYTDLGLEVPENVNMFERRFLSQVDISKGDIERTVTAMYRLRAPDYLSLSLSSNKNKEDVKVPPRREFIFYMERWEAKSWRGIPLNPVMHTVGVYNKQFLKPHYNQQDGGIDYEELDVGRAQTVYYIPYSAKKVDEIINASARSDKDTIVYCLHYQVCIRRLPLGTTCTN